MRAPHCIAYNVAVLEFQRRVLDALARIEQTQADQGRLLARILQKENAMSLDLTALTAKVSAQETVEQSAITLLQELNAAVKALPTTDPATQAAIDALATRIDAGTQGLAAAVVANTPAAPAPATPPAA